MNNTNRLFLILFLLGAFLRGVDVWHPVNGQIRESWRECDYAAIARNYVEEGMNILYPKIDWRDEGPGFAEMEFPIVPWTIAVLYKYFGFNEIYGKLLSWLFSLISLFLFLHFARSELSDNGALFSFLFFVLSPLAVYISSTLQPEGLMFCSYLAAVIFFRRWVDEEEPVYFFLAMLSTALTLLVKINTLHIGLVFLYLLLEKNGWKTFGNYKIWLFAVLALLPAALWYYHAHQLWIVYQKSLGVSNESHWIGLDLLLKPGTLLAVLKIEIFNVWTPLGFFSVLFYLLSDRRDRLAGFSVVWLSSILIYYFAAARTTGDDWAKYYHVVSAAPFALLVGMSAQYFMKFLNSNFLRLFLIWLSVFSALLFTLLKLAFAVALSLSALVVIHLLLALVIFAVVQYWCKNAEYAALSFFENRVPGRLVGMVVLFAFASVFISQGFRAAQFLKPVYMTQKYECAQKFKKLLPEGALILASGGYGIDQTKKPVAYNAPYYFYWLHRKGFNIPREAQSVANVQNFKRRGAEYFVAEREEMQKAPGFELALRQNFALLAECDAVLLFRLINAGGE